MDYHTIKVGTLETISITQLLKKVTLFTDLAVRSAFPSINHKTCELCKSVRELCKVSPVPEPNFVRLKFMQDLLS